MAIEKINKDGVVLIRDTDRFPEVLFIETIYQGELTKNNPKAIRVPNVGDMVVDRSSGYPRFLEVVYVDEMTLIPTLVEAEKPNSNDFSKENRLLGVGPGYQSETWRLYIDTSVVPHVFVPDSRLLIKGKENTKYKVFLGTDISAATGRVISMNFNNNGELISEDIPLEKVAFPSTDVIDTNLSVKVCRKGYTTTKLENGDIVTLVTYNDSGVGTSYNVLMVHNTALDKSIESSQKYVTSIGLVSPFLDKTENNTLIFPMNMPRDALALMARVNYSDGSSKDLAIDGNRVVLEGFGNYIPMKSNQLMEFSLIYNLPNGEMALNSSMGSKRFIAVSYFGRTTPVDGSYSVALYPIPTWVSDTYGWKLRWFMYTLDRDIAYEVTNLVMPGANTKPFEPLKYGETQEVTVSLDLSLVDPRLKRFIHVQSFKIALMGRPGPGLPTAYLIHYEKDQEKPYGQNIQCRAIRDPGLNKWRLNIASGASTLEEWLDRIYFRTKPLTDMYSEKRPPMPTHFTLIVNDTQVTYPIRAWNSTIEFPIGAEDGHGVVIQFSRIDGINEFQLAAAPLNFNDISEGGVLDHGGGDVDNGPENPIPPSSTVLDIDEEVKIIVDRNASHPIVEKYRELLERIKRYGLLKYANINTIYQRIKYRDLTPATIANDVILLEIEVNRISIGDFNRDTTTNIAPSSMEG